MIPFLLGALLILPTGCRLLVATTGVAVGAVGLAGYSVYKTGEAVATGVGNVVSSGAKGVGSVVYSGGEFKAVCPGRVEHVWLATATVFKARGFRLVSGNRDALSGNLTIATNDGEEIAVRLDDAGGGQTEFRLRIGVKGDLAKSQTLYTLVLDEYARQRAGKSGTGS